MKALVLADVPSPHQNAFFDAVAQLGEVDLEVLFSRRTMPGRAWSGEGPRLAKHRFLRSVDVRGVPVAPQMLPEVLAAPEAMPVLIGWYLPGLFATGLALGALRRPWIFWTDSLPPPKKGEPVRRRLVRRWFLDRSTLSLSTGEAGRQALMAHGVPPARAFGLPFVVDQEAIRRGVAAELPHRDELRSELGVPAGARALLYVGQMIRRKGIDVLLDALALQLRRGPAPFLLLLGEGADLAEFKAQAKRLGVEGSVRFLDYVDNSKLPRFWAAADAFVLPSRFDPWGVVVLEALIAGLPVIGTDSCGAVRDLIAPQNGFRCAAGDVIGLADALQGLMSADLSAMAAAARASAVPLEPLQIARGFTRVLYEAQRLHRETSP